MPPGSPPSPPEPPRGMRDLLPDEAAAFERLRATVAAVYRRFGFRPLETPALELERTLRGEEGETAGQIYTFTDRDEVALGLRFDLTVPLARVVAAHARELRFPFKRSQYARVWRFDKVTPGRFREFGQFDADIVGTRAPSADAEICLVIGAVLEALGFRRFVVRLNHRGLLGALAARVGLTDEARAKQLFRELDKIDKQGLAVVRANLGPRPEPAALRALPEEERARLEAVDFVGLAPEQIALVERFLALGGPLGEQPAPAGEVAVPAFAPVDEVLDGLDAFFAGGEAGGDAGRAAVAELRAVVRAMAGAGTLPPVERYDRQAADGPPGCFAVDPTIARGLDYYTGPVFETTLLDFPAFGSIFSGGRYDRLIGRFLDFDAFFHAFQEYRDRWRDAAGRPLLPATGASLGIDRLFAVMQRLGLTGGAPPPADVMIATMDESLIGEYQRLGAELRAAGFAVEVFCGDAPKLKAQLRYADATGIPLVVLLGSREQEQGVVTLRDMRGGGLRKDEDAKQQEVPRAELAARIRALLGEGRDKG